MLPWAFAILALALRVPALGRSIWLDEYFSLQAATEPDFLSALRYYDHPPLYFIFMRGWSAFGGSEAFLRLPSLAFGAMAIGVLVKWMQPDRLSGVLMGSLAVALPILCDQSLQIRHYSLLVLETALSFYFASQLATAGDGRGAIGLASSLCAAVATHLVGGMVVVSVAAFLVCRGAGPRRLDAVLAVALPIVVFGAIYFGFMIGVRGKTAESWWIPSLTIASAWHVGLDLSGFGVFDSTRRVALIVVPIGVAVAALGDWRRSFPYLVAGLVYWAGVLLYSLLVIPIVLPRVLLPGVVPFLGFVAVQTASVRPKAARWVCSLAVVLLATCMARGWWVGGAFQEPEPWHTIAGTIQDEWHPQARIVVVPGFSDGPLRFYLSELPADAFVPIPSHQVAPRVNNTSGGRHTLFLVVRWDATVNDGSLGYEAAVAHVQRTLAPPLWTRRLGRLSLSKYENATIEASR
jgi:hypothetical protein